ncbi:MAG: hypothetical protein ACFCUL_01080 [Flavobacteriaceae bacterium]
MHEKEGLVEDSVHVVAKSSMTPGIKRDVLFNLYRFQAMFDTGYTHFRVIHTLLDLKFTYRIPLEKYPDYAEHKPYFGGLDVAREPLVNANVAAKGGGSKTSYCKRMDFGL